MQFGFKTDSVNPGQSSVTLTLTWKNKEYVCTISGTPLTVNTFYSCDSNDWIESHIKKIDENPYFMKIEYSQLNPLQIAEIEVTLMNGDIYNVDRFCIAPKMTCTIDKVISGEYTSSNCDQWKSKAKYNKLALGGATKFELLYVDFEIVNDRYANELIEGGVRPPNLVQYGIDLGYFGGHPSLAQTHPIDFSIQWDTVFYGGAEIIDSHIAQEYIFDVKYESLICPGLPSDFWISIYNDYVNVNEDGTLTVFGIIFIDETGRRYEFRNLCQQDGYWNRVDFYPACPDPSLAANGYKQLNVISNSAVIVGGPAQTYAWLVPFILPECIYDYPDDGGANSEYVAALNGMYKDIQIRNQTTYCQNPLPDFPVSLALIIKDLTRSILVFTNSLLNHTHNAYTYNRNVSG